MITIVEDSVTIVFNSVTELSSIISLFHVLILQYTESRSNYTSVLEAYLSLVAQ